MEYSGEEGEEENRKMKEENRTEGAEISRIPEFSQRLLELGGNSGEDGQSWRTDCPEKEAFPRAESQDYPGLSHSGPCFTLTHRQITFIMWE